MPYYKKIFISAVFVILAIGIAYTVEAYEVISKLNGKVIRLHVVANSDSFEDQQLKYQVRNQIIKTFNEEFEKIDSKEESENIIIEEIHQIRCKAEEIVKEEGYNYDINVYYGNYKFPRKMYEEIVLPEGYYDAVRIEIGKAEGGNWWCVMFPPLCFVDFGKNENINIFDFQTEKKLQEVLTLDEIDIIKTKRGIGDIKLKSKIFEIIEKGRVEKTGIYSIESSHDYAVSLSK